VWIASLKARRHENLREPAEIGAGALVATRCSSLDAIIGLGRSLQNCLAQNNYHWEEFVSGKIDIWSLRVDSQLVAVLAVKKASNRISEARGPFNKIISVRHIQDVALFCRKADFSIPADCEGLLAEYAENPMLGPKIVVLDDCIAEYAEWSNSVRIDIVDQDYHGWPISIGYNVLSLVFDPAVSCAREILDGRNLPDTVKSFGGERLRQIVQTIAMDEATPSLVQHRLLALAA
jgi:hypothetical protein